jgi:hypothetical protein
MRLPITLAPVRSNVSRTMSLSRPSSPRVDLEDITVIIGGDVLARHSRSLAKHRTICDPAHAAERDALRALAGTINDDHDDRVEVRDLAVYDRALGVA